MSGIPRDFDPPENWQDFERLALRLLQRRWHCVSLELFGGRGQKQYGVDIIDQSGGVPFRAGQCKRYDRTQALTEADIRIEIEKAKSFPLRIEQYAIVTTAKRSTTSQLALIKINKEHAEQGLFEVVLITWDQINEFLNENSDIADLFYGGLGAQAVAQIAGQLNELLESARATSPIAKDQGAPSPFDNDIDEAKRYFEDHQYSVSRLLLQRLRERHWDLLSSRQRFRILSNLGASRLAEGDGEAAARLFLEAKEFQPEDRLALENEVLACDLLGLGNRAFSLAAVLRERFPFSGRAWSAWLEHSPSTVGELEAQIPDEVKTSVEVCMVMARRSLMEQEYTRAERYARKAVEALPARAYPSWLLGQALLTAQVLKGGVDQRFGDKSDESQKLREALKFFNASADLAKKEGSNRLRALAFLGGSFVRDMLGEKAEAEADVEAAFRDAPDDPSVLVSYATMLRTRGDLSKAIDTLRKAVRNGVIEQGTYLLAESLSIRSETGDLEEAVDLCGKLIASTVELQPGLREHALATKLNSLAKLGRLDEAEAALDNLPPGALSPLALDCVRARILLLRNSTDEARQIAIQANQLVGDGTSPGDLRTLAQLLTELGQYAEALPHWTKLGADRATMNYDTQELINCAARLGQDGLLLDIARRLRESGIKDQQLFRMEVGLLERYDGQAAVELIQEYLKDHPDDRSIRLRLSMLGLVHGKPELVSARIEDVPPVDKVEPREGAAAVWLLRMANNPNDALSYAYKLLRTHFGDLNAARAFRLSMDPVGPSPDVPEFSKVEAGAAVCFVEEGSTTEQWVIVEDSDRPDAKLGERSPEDPLVIRLLGKTPGDSFLLAEGRFSGTDRRGTIKRIVSKFVHRYQELLSKWQFQFQSGEIEMFTFNAQTMPPGGTTIDLTPITTVIEQRHEALRELERVYSSQPAAIHELAALIGINDLQLLGGLANRDQLSLRCCDGTTEEINEALTAITGCGAIVIDFVAIATLILLDRLDVLRSSPIHIVVSQSTLAVLQQMLIEATSSLGAKSGVLTKIGDRFVFADQTESAKQAYIEDLKRAISTIKSSCKVTGAISLAYLDPEERNLLIAKFGQHGAESLVLATNPGNVL